MPEKIFRPRASVRRARERRETLRRNPLTRALMESIARSSKEALQKTEAAKILKGKEYRHFLSTVKEEQAIKAMQIAGKQFFDEAMHEAKPTFFAFALNNCDSGIRFGKMLKVVGNARIFAMALREFYEKSNLNGLYELFDDNQLIFKEFLANRYRHRLSRK